DPAEDHGAEEDADEARCKDRPERRALDVPVAHEVRCRKRNCGDVVSVEKRNQRRPEEELDVKRRHPSLVEQRRHWYYGSIGHVRFLLACNDRTAWHALHTSVPGPKYRGRSFRLMFSVSALSSNGRVAIDQQERDHEDRTSCSARRD